MAVERVEQLLRKVTGALEVAGIPYAVIGGNAVAAWVATVDELAVRATKDVNILLRREDLERAAAAVAPAGLIPAEVFGVPMFIDRERPSPRSAVHIVIAGERVKPSDTYAAPDPVTAARPAAGFKVLDFYELLAMKLQAFRPADRTHIEDLLELGLLAESLVARLPADLRTRFDEIEREWKIRQPE